MSTRQRLSPTESRNAALAAARELLIEFGPSAVTLKAVAARIGRTHANLLHHFGTAGDLQRALAGHLANTICHAIAPTVLAAREGGAQHRQVVDMVFDAFAREGGGALACWMLLNGNEDALDPIVEAIHALMDDIHDDRPHGFDDATIRRTTLKLVLLALGDSLMGGPLTAALGLARGAARDVAEAMLVARAGSLKPASDPVVAG